ncbi:hypothetical protein [Brevundimonas sp.]
MIELMMAAALIAQASPTYSAPTTEQFERARQSLNATLLDYPTARFRDVHGDQRRLCGFVNSKNRMGAYVGWDRFVVLGLPGSEPIYETDDQIGRVALLCDQIDPPLPNVDYSDQLTAR